MGDAVQAAVVSSLITLVGNVLVAVVTRVPSDPAEARRRRRCRCTIVAVVVTAVLSGGLMWLVVSDRTHRRIEAALHAGPDDRKVVYERVGLGIAVPLAWHLSDASFRFGGGNIDIVRDYNPESGGIVQGIMIRIQNVKDRFIKDPSAEEAEALADIRKLDENATVADATVGEYPARRFSYAQETSQGVTRAETLWVRLTPRVKLVVFSRSSLDKSASGAFDREKEVIINSIVLDAQKIAELEEQSRS